MCRTITKLEAAVKQLVNQAASGDLGAMRQLSALAGSAEEERGTPLIRELDQEDQKVMENVNRSGNFMPCCTLIIPCSVAY